MDKTITAKWARDEANAILGKKVIAQIETCEDSIKLAVKKNQMYCTIF